MTNLPNKRNIEEIPLLIAVILLNDELGKLDTGSLANVDTLSASNDGVIGSGMISESKVVGIVEDSTARSGVFDNRPIIERIQLSDFEDESFDVDKEVTIDIDRKFDGSTDIERVFTIAIESFTI